MSKAAKKLKAIDSLIAAGDYKTAYSTICKLPEKFQNKRKMFYLLGKFTGECLRQNKLHAAEKYTKRALELWPDQINALDVMGWLYIDKGQYEQALGFFKRCLEIDKHFAHGRQGAFQTLALLGKVKEAYEGLDYSIPELYYIANQWRGQDLTGKTIYIHGFGGVGDKVNFSVYISHMQHAKKIVFGCDERLYDLFTNNFSNVKCIDSPKVSFLVKERIQYYVSLQELPKIFGVQPFKNKLRANSNLINKYYQRYACLGHGPKIGISWRSGGGEKLKGIRRTISVEEWKPLFDISGIHWINLQYGECFKDIQNIKDKYGIEIHDWEDSDPLRDLNDFAAKVSALDLVISIDNSTIHFSGALGVPTWTMLPFTPDWRWFLHRDDSPWFPSMRLFRQPKLGDWESVINAVQSALKSYIGSQMDRKAG